MTALWNIGVSALVLAVGVVLVLIWLRRCGAPLPLSLRTDSQAQEGTEVGRREAVQVFSLSILFRLAVLLLGFLILWRLADVTRLVDTLPFWKRWDAWHYVGLAEQGYRGYTEDGQHLFLVFFPLYVWLMRLFRLLVGDTIGAGLLVSWLSYAGGCVYFYRLAAFDWGRAAARRAVVLLSLFPFGFFFGGVMTEGLFFLTTSAALWHIRRRRWLAAGIWGALAAMTRMHGLLLVGAAAAELVEQEQLFARPGGRIRSVLAQLPALLLPLAGTAVYLGLNLWVEGDPFAFVRMQDHWSQGSNWISGTLGYVLQNALTYGDTAVRVQIWIPTLVLFPLFLGLLWAVRRRARSMYLLYGYVYLVLNYSLSWLLSAGRYLSCALPFFLFAAALTARRPRLFALVACASGALFVAALSVYLTGGQIM